MPGPITADRLKSFVERVEKLEEERAAIGGDVRDVLSEAKGVGYDVKTIRKVVALRKMDAADRAEQETLLDVYRNALGMEPAAGVESEEQLDARALKLAREVDRVMALTNTSQPPKIEAIMRALTCSAGKASKLRKLCEERLRDPRAERENENENENENEKPAAREMMADDLWAGAPDLMDLAWAARDAEIANDINPGAGASGTAKPDGQLAPTGDFGPQRPFQGAAGSPSEPTGPADIGKPTSVNVDAAAAPSGDKGIDDQGPGSGTQYELSRLAADVLALPPGQVVRGATIPTAQPDDDLAFPTFLRRAPEEAA